MKYFVVLVAILASSALAACGSGPPSGSDAAGGGGGSGGTGGMPGLNCPADPPSSGATCTSAGSCYYEDCSNGGRTIASCGNGAWAIQTGPCAAFNCRSNTCQAGQICIERIGGALLVECVTNGCGTAAIGCNCLQSCSGNCAVTGSVQTGITVMCNTCPSNMCA